jgi:hypothetical protein
VPAEDGGFEVYDPRGEFLAWTASVSTAAPEYTSDARAFRAVLDVIDARGLGREYAMHLSRLSRRAGFDFTTPSDYAWKLLRAPLPLCASAALQVLAANSPEIPDGSSAARS